jgi:mRNA interferase MazF
LDPPAGRRPVLIVTRSAAVTARDQVTVAVVTRTARGLRSEVRLDTARDGLPKDCVVNCDVLQTVRKARLAARMTALSAARMAEVEAALKFALGRS